MDTLKSNGMMKIGITAGVAAGLVLLRPFGMSWTQSILLGGLLLTILWWVTGAVKKTAASIFLLALFLVVGRAPLQTVFSFPLSPNFLLIVFSFLFSQGITNSGLAEKLLAPWLARVARTPLRLMLAMLACVLLMIPVIPQPFSRVILLGAIFAGFFDSLGLAQALKRVLLFGLFSFSIFANMLVIRGDIILNNALLGFGGFADMSEGTWFRYMGVPTVLFFGVSVCLYGVVFRKTLRTYSTDGADKALLAVSAERSPESAEASSGVGTAGVAGAGPGAGAVGVDGEAPVRSPKERESLTRKDKRNLVLILAVVAFWALEDVHGIPGTYIVIGATVLLFALGLLKPKDLKSIDITLLFFLTAAFSIGGVLKYTGIADILFSKCTRLFPAQFGWAYVLVVIAVSMLLHMVLGSNVTTMSVVVPGLLLISQGVVPPEIVMFLIYVSVCAHYLLPFHQVIMMIGEGQGHYSTKEILRYGIPMTGVVILGIFLFYLPWWRFAGLL